MLETAPVFSCSLLPPNFWEKPHPRERCSTKKQPLFGRRAQRSDGRCLTRLSCSQALMTDETISNVPILILGNKIDRPEAISEEKLREIFGLYGQTTGKVGRGRGARRRAAPEEGLLAGGRRCPGGGRESSDPWLGFRRETCH